MEPESNIFIDGIGINKYRSFGEAVEHIGPFRKINFFVGQNNSGKSNVLKFLHGHFHNLIKNTLNTAAHEYAGFDLNVNQNEKNPRIFALPILFGGQRFTRAASKINDGIILGKLLESIKKYYGTDEAWIYYHSINSAAPFSISDQTVAIARDWLDKHEWLQMWRALGFGQNTSDLNAAIRESLKAISLGDFELPEVSFIGANRKIGNRNSEPKDFDGDGIIERLSRLQNPPLASRHEKKKFENINSFLKKVTGNQTAQIEIPVTKEEILVEIDEKALPLHELGTGIHEVVILAAAATILEKQIVCIEEPELHLHPLLQRKLVRYLQEKTSNQYFFSTHSAHILDTPDSAVFHVRQQEGTSHIEMASSPSARTSVCFDLGYIASDLLQANCIVWVEGPTDRIYLNHWIKTVDDKLEEGIHYSIMFYGGRLLSHLTANDPEVSEFISLRRLNRYITIVIDSDRKKMGSKISPTKQRVKDEFEKAAGMCWITKGREIENYIDSKILIAAIKKVYPKANELLSDDAYEKCYFYKTIEDSEITQDIDKVKIAHAVTEQPANLDVLDLRKQIGRIIDFIKNANDTEPYFLD